MSNAFLKSFVNTEDCNPYSDSLQILTASSKSLTLIIGNTGPNGSSQAICISKLTLSNTTGHNKFPSLLIGVNALAPFSTASLINPSTKSADFVSINGVISALSNGSPTVNLLTFS